MGSRTCILPLTIRVPYHQAQPAHMLLIPKDSALRDGDKKSKTERSDQVLKTEGSRHNPFVVCVYVCVCVVCSV